MLALNSLDAMLVAGLLLIAGGGGGMVMVVVGRRRTANASAWLASSLRPALVAATGVINPSLPSLPIARTGAGEALTEASSPRTVNEDLDQLRSPNLGEIPEAEQLLTRLFTIRMMLSDLAEEVHTLRDQYHLEDDDLDDDIDDTADDVDAFGDGSFGVARKIRKAA